MAIDCWSLRHRSATFLFATICILLSVCVTAQAFPNASIANIAEKYPNGSRQGQCIVFVANVLRQASSGRIRISAYASGYQGTYSANHGALVSNRSNAGRGDVIQVTPRGTSDRWKGPEYSPLHTAIILKNLGGGNFMVIDSNARYDERVLRHTYNPYSRGGTVKIWRMGTVTHSSPKPHPSTPAPASTGHADSVGMYFPWDHSMHLRNSLSSGPSDYAFSYGTSSGGVEGVPLSGDWDGH